MEYIFFLNNDNTPIYLQLYQAVVNEIVKGNLKSDVKLPSVRNLSKAMNISKTTVEDAYGQLVAEGYIYAKPQSGYYVMPLAIHEGQEYKAHHDIFNEENKVKTLQCKTDVTHEPISPKRQKHIDFASEYVDESNFNMMVWKKSINAVFQTTENKLFSHNDPYGEDELKQMIVQYFTRMRGIVALSEQIIISASTSSLLGELAFLFHTKGYSHLSMEEPGYNVAKDVFLKAGYKIEGIPLQDKVLDVECLRDKVNSVIFTSPSYQFPYGEMMPMQTRYELLNIASLNNCYIIEDDYNNELRYTGKPIHSLQGMDSNHRVIYLGSFSTILLPSIRISFMVLPQELFKTYQTLFKERVQNASKLEQLALAHMMKSGNFAKHIRRLRKNYAQKQGRVAQLCKQLLEEFCECEIPNAGLNAVFKIKKMIDIEEFYEQCDIMDIRLTPLSHFLLNKDKSQADYIFVINYRGISDQLLEAGLLKVRDILCQLF